VPIPGVRLHCLVINLQQQQQQQQQQHVMTPCVLSDLLHAPIPEVRLHSLVINLGQHSSSSSSS
jgi:hypothetical protein